MLNTLSGCDELAAVCGRSELKRNVQVLLRAGEASPVALFCGEKGLGKKFLSLELTIPLLFSRPLASGERDDVRRRIREGIHPDVHRLLPAASERLIPVARLRAALAEHAGKKPQLAERVVWVIDLQALNEQGQNALLKTLEEAPSFSAFLLLAETREAVLATIRSRAQLFTLPLLSETELREICMIEEGKEALEARGGEEQLRLALAYAAGNPGRCLALLRREDFAEELRRDTDDFLSFLRSERGPAVAALFRQIKSRHGTDFSRFAFFVAKILRDMALLAALTEDRSLDATTKKKELDRLIVHRSDLQNLYRHVKQKPGLLRYAAAEKALRHCEDRLARYANFELTVSAFLLELYEELNG